MTDNLKLWNQFADIDPDFTKPITGKPYKGTSPNPHYVIRCLTEMFGPVGVGFGWEVVSEGFQPIGEEILHWCRIRFWHGGGRGFEAYGQTKALMKTRNGFMSDEDAPKKSLTDAITKAAAQIGVASNIFLGRWDDSRYVEQVNQAYREAEREAAPRDPRVIADGLIGAVKKAKNYQGVGEIIAGEKFDAAWRWLEANDPPKAGEVKKAVNDMRNKFDPAAQGPDDREAA